MAKKKKKGMLARGMRDLLPEDMRRWQYVTDKLRVVFERYGFEAIETPALEREDVLFGKYGPDAERLIYRAGLGGKMDHALRYDLSVPLARVVSSYDDIPKPFRRYQIASVWRGERPQRGRYRQFVQADIDIVGSSSMLADAEIICVVVGLLQELGFPETSTKVNNRQVLNGIGRFAGVPDSQLPGLYRSIDKLDKIGIDGVRNELRGVGLPGELLNRQRQGVDRWLLGKADRDRLHSDFSACLTDLGHPDLVPSLDVYLDSLGQLEFGSGTQAEGLRAKRQRIMKDSIQALRASVEPESLIPDSANRRLLDLIQVEGSPREVLAELGQFLEDEESARGLADLETLIDALDAAGVDQDRYEVDPAMVRGLEYYTGTIFETVVSNPPIGSGTGGGRFDRLTGLFGREIPAVGTSFGVDRLIDVMDELGLFPSELERPATQVYVGMLDSSAEMQLFGVAQDMRTAGVACHAAYEANDFGRTYPRGART